MVPAYNFHKMETQHVRHSVTVFLIQMVVWVNGILSLGFGSHSSSIVLSPDESKVAAVNQDSGTISIWSWLEDRSNVNVFHVGEEPRTLAYSPHGELIYVTTQRSQWLSILDATTGTLLDRIELGGQPLAIVLSQDGTRAYVSQFSGDYISGDYSPGSIAVINLNTRKLTQRIPVSAWPYALARNDNNQTLYITHYFHNQENGLITELDLDTLRVRNVITLVPDKDLTGGSGGIFNAIASIALHPSRHRALIAGMHANIHRGKTQNGQPLSHKTTVQSALRVIDLKRSREMVPARIISSFSGQAVAVPSAVSFLPDGEHFIDLYFASHDMKILRYNERGLVAERALMELRDGPDGIAITQDGHFAFINQRWDRSIAQIEIQNIRKPKRIQTARKCTEPWTAKRILGARVFHNTRESRMTPNRWLSCGVCHLDGGLASDQLVWEFTATQKPSSPIMVNTKSLAVTGLSGPPFLIKGNYHTIQEEDQFVRSFLAGTGFIHTTSGSFPKNPVGLNPSMDAIAEFVIQLRPRPNPHQNAGQPRSEIKASAQRGKTLFYNTRVGCSRCHRGSAFTVSGTPDGQPVDVGTGIKADIPSLLNLWETAPYLHDGRAKNLLQVITQYNAEDRHGRTGHLSDKDRTDLIHFLLTPH